MCLFLKILNEENGLFNRYILQKFVTRTFGRYDGTAMMVDYFCGNGHNPQIIGAHSTLKFQFSFQGFTG